MDDLDPGSAQAREALQHMMARGVILRDPDGRFVFSEGMQPMMAELAGDKAEEEPITPAEAYRAAIHALHFMIDNQYIIPWWAAAHGGASAVTPATLLAAQRMFADLADLEDLAASPSAEDPQPPGPPATD